MNRDPAPHSSSRPVDASSPGRFSPPFPALHRASSAVLPLVLLVLTSLSGIGAELSDQEVLKRLAADQPRDRAVVRALTWLRNQQKADGAVGDKHTTALTAMAIMAHFAAGHPPADKEYGPWLRKSLQHVLSKQ